MVRSFTEKLLSLLLCIGVLCPFFTAHAEKTNRQYTVAEVERLSGGIVAYKDGVSAQHFIDHGLCDSAGISAEFYIIALRQQGNYDFSAYEKALLDYLDKNEVYSATSREKYALALIASGSRSAYIKQIADEAIGGLGLMSLVFGLHILNNGYQSKLYTTSALIDTILANQLSDGGWAVIGSRGDVDVTAMTLQALAPYYRTNSNVKAAVNSALTLLSGDQQSDGGFYGMGVENCESAAQVVTALSDLGFDANSDSRFVKNGHSALDAMLRFRNADGSFCHIAGKGANENATTQAFYALTAYLRHLKGQGPLYMLDRQDRQTTPATEQQGDDSRQRQSGNASQRISDQAQDSPQKTEDNADDHSEDRTPQSSTYYSDPNSGGQSSPYDHQADRQTQTAPAQKNTQKPTQTATSTDTATAAENSTQAPTEKDAGKGAGIFQPTGTATEPPAIDDEPKTDQGSYKPYAVCGILAAAGLTAIVLYLLKKRNKKHYIAVGIIAAAGVLFILLTHFESTESYHQAKEKTDAVGTVTITVRCDSLKDDDIPDTIPDDCIILDETTFAVAEGDTVYDILIEASKRCNFQVDNRGAAGSAYIAGIEYLYEFDYGDLSGWMYRVDGEFPDVGCQSYQLHGGEKIEWLYTKNIGKDL